MLTALSLILALHGQEEYRPIPAQVTYKMDIRDLDGHETSVTFRTLDGQSATVFNKSKLGDIRMNVMPKVDSGRGELKSDLDVSLDEKPIGKVSNRSKQPSTFFVVLSKGRHDRVSVSSKSKKPHLRAGDVFFEFTGKVIP